ncbi:MAG TPA: SGNH/GDSL hydrolase family protein, partial [Sphingomicrobium sp.]|nr:SGNH/GDSL hydrolase family protein [Sphingomicrobium sp.]
MAYSGVYVFGDSLVDAGNVLKLADWYGGLTFGEVDGAPYAEDGYYLGRFSNGFTFADLISNKSIGAVTKPIFPYGYEDPLFGLPIDPLASDPSGNNLNFAYGGAQIRQGDMPDLDQQTDAFKDAVDNRAPSGALYIVTMGGNDVRALAPAGADPVNPEDAEEALRECALQLIHELTQLIASGARYFLITGVPDVGLIPKYDDEPGQPGYGALEGEEIARSAAATRYSEYLDNLIQTQVV